jgi:inhibitor of cysteine peptidase
MPRSFALLALAALVSSWSATGGEPRHLEAGDSGSTVKLAKGDAFTVVLKENRTTGYSWSVVVKGEPVLEQAGEPRYVEDSKLHGAGGLVTYSFNVVAAGTATLRLAYARPWEKEVKPAETFEVTVVVEK